MRLLTAAALAVLVVSPAAAQDGARGQTNLIIDEGFNRSQVMETAAHLTDRIGGRLTNSPQMRAAEAWTQQRFRDWGLTNVHAEPFEFGRGWSIVSSSARMTSPRVVELRAIPIAWTPATSGTVRAPIVVAPMTEEKHFDKWRGKLAGKIVLVSQPGTGSEPKEAPFQRLSDKEISELDQYRQPVHEEGRPDQRLKRRKFPLALDAFLKSEGALAWVRISARDGSLLHGTGYTHHADETPALPAMELAAEDYRRLARLAKTDAQPVLELTSNVRFHDEDSNAYNVIGDIQGSDPKAGYVMAGAHLDSWVAGDGAADNAAGSAVIMEAARILSSLRVKPKRTIRFALWNAEEQGLLGSLAYIDRHIASRPLDTDPEKAKLPMNFGWANRYPITPRPGHRDLVAYFNIDNGSGKIRGIHAEGNVAAVPVLQEWLAPFGSMGASKVVASPTTGTDHVFLQSVGIPGYQFIQDPLDYDSRIHHTNVDTYDHLKAEDMRQAAVILASVLLSAANSAEPLPRMPLPSKPRPSDPFAYPTDDE
ncbi:MAG TPA: M20/M25/M40 family metallo-hydrolase [Allosphingosinicella sp.]|jgi:hypothetical protein